MPNYVLYRGDIETIEPDEEEMHRQTIEVMTEGQNITRGKYGKAVRISHAKTHGLLKGKLLVEDGLPAELAQGVFANPGRFPVIVRMTTSPGKFTDDSKVSTGRAWRSRSSVSTGRSCRPSRSVSRTKSCVAMCRTRLIRRGE